MKTITLQVQVPDDSINTYPKALKELTERIEPDAVFTILDQSVIHAKALRKRGTNEWYYWSSIDGWYSDTWLTALSELEMGVVLKQCFPPSDAELVDIEIIVKEDGK